MTINQRYRIFKKYKKKYRKINEHAFKILEAPGYSDDFYTHLLDWNSQNQVTLSISDDIYLHNVENSST